MMWIYFRLVVTLKIVSNVRKNHFRYVDTVRFDACCKVLNHNIFQFYRDGITNKIAWFMLELFLHHMGKKCIKFMKFFPAQGSLVSYLIDCFAAQVHSVTITIVIFLNRLQIIISLVNYCCQKIPPQCFFHSDDYNCHNY